MFAYTGAHGARYVISSPLTFHPRAMHNDMVIGVAQ